MTRKEIRAPKFDEIILAKQYYFECLNAWSFKEGAVKMTDFFSYRILHGACLRILPAERSATALYRHLDHDLHDARRKSCRQSGSVAIFRIEHRHLPRLNVDRRPFARRRAETDVLIPVVRLQDLNALRRRPADDFFAGDDILDIDVLLV